MYSKIFDPSLMVPGDRMSIVTSIGKQFADLILNPSGGEIPSPPYTKVNSLYFDGLNQGAWAPASAGYALGTAFSIMAWVYLDTAKSSSKILSNFDHSGNNGIDFGVLTDFGFTRNLALAIGDGSGIDFQMAETGDLELHIWHHVAATYDGSNFRFYKNGSLIATKAATRSVSSSSVVMGMGRRYDSTPDYFPGFIDEKAIIRRKLESAEIAAVYQDFAATDLMLLLATPSDIVDYTYNGDSDDSLDGILDRSGNNHDYTLDVAQNLATFATDDRLTGGVTVMAGLTAFTLAGVASADSGSATETICSKDDRSGTPHPMVQVQFDGGKIAAYVWGPYPNYLGRIMAVAVTPGQLYNWAVTYDGGTTQGAIRLWVNGVEETATYSGGTFTGIADTGAEFLVGCMYDGSYSRDLNGKQGWLAIWDEAIGALEAAEITSNGPYFDPQTNLGNYTSALNVIDHWQFGRGSLSFTAANGIPNLKSARHLTAVNMSAASAFTWIQAEVPGWISTTWLKNDTNGKVFAAASGSVFAPEWNTPWSVTCLVSFVNVAGDKNLIFSKTKNGSPYSGQILHVESDGKIDFQFSSSQGPNWLRVRTPIGTIVDNTLYRITITLDGTGTAAGTKIYVNGAPQTLTVMANTLSATVINTTPFVIGTEWTGNWHSGHIKSLGWWNKSLSGAEETALGGAVDTNLRAHSAFANLQDCWQMERGRRRPDTAAVIYGANSANNLAGTSFVVGDYKTFP